MRSDDHQLCLPRAKTFGRERNEETSVPAAGEGEEGAWDIEGKIDWNEEHK